jgi:rod shape-determining protein MreB and related proteins
MSVFGSDLAIDLGTANTCIFALGRGIVLNEPSVVAFNTRRGSVEAVGSDARDMLGRSPPYITPVRPMKHGVIADFDALEKMLSAFLRRASPRGWRRPRLIIGVPAGINSVERRAVRESAARVNAAGIHLVDEPMAAAVGVGLPVTEPIGSMIVDIGGGTTDIAVLSMAGIVYGRSLRVAGNSMDLAIEQYMRRAHGLLVGERTAEQIKIEIGSAAPFDEPRQMEVSGRHLAEGVPRTILINDAQVREALGEPVGSIIQAVREALEQVPPELSADIYERGMTLTGGGALLKGLDRRLCSETGLPIHVAADPLFSVVLGAGRLLSDGDLLARVATS